MPDNIRFILFWVLMGACVLALIVRIAMHEFPTRMRVALASRSWRRKKHIQSPKASKWSRFNTAYQRVDKRLERWWRHEKTTWQLRFVRMWRFFRGHKTAPTPAIVRAAAAASPHPAVQAQSIRNRFRGYVGAFLVLAIILATGALRLASNISVSWKGVLLTLAITLAIVLTIVSMMKGWHKSAGKKVGWIIRGVLQLAVVAAAIFFFAEGVSAFETYIGRQNRALSDKRYSMQSAKMYYVDHFGSVTDSVLPNRPVLVNFDPDFLDHMAKVVRIRYTIVEDGDPSCIYVNYSHELCPGKKGETINASQYYFQLEKGDRPRQIIVSVYKAEAEKQRADSASDTTSTSPDSTETPYRIKVVPRKQWWSAAH